MYSFSTGRTIFQPVSCLCVHLDAQLKILNGNPGLWQNWRVAVVGYVGQRNLKWSYLTPKIHAIICPHDSSEIIARTLTLFVYISPVVKHDRSFNASYIFHVYSIELMFDVDYMLLSLVFSTDVHIVCVKTQWKHWNIKHHDKTKQ